MPPNWASPVHDVGRLHVQIPLIVKADVHSISPKIIFYHYRNSRATFQREKKRTPPSVFSYGCGYDILCMGSMAGIGAGSRLVRKNGTACNLCGRSNVLLADGRDADARAGHRNHLQDLLPHGILGGVRGDPTGKRRHGRYAKYLFKSHVPHGTAGRYERRSAKGLALSGCSEPV